ncbi:thiopeptide-type bacteriocin biosynthesis protein [Gemmatimonas sp.]|uniref:thiopeptide-type bacteriocin biosynthesis protein n=1 Tax=Gemmatimonas sp. TaxID=1962908 RepID=UPI00286E7A0B|nr:thiopeptide-type bacteriocin biosynthesis protein [Gemmatimonas sp.]
MIPHTATEPTDSAPALSETDQWRVRRWTSHHVHFASPAADSYDRVIADWVASVVAELRESALIERYFFIRYPVGGPHVRLRMAPRTEDAEAGIERVLFSHASRWNRAVAPKHTLEVRPVPYEPEFDRYAGPVGLALCESIFEASSDWVVQFLRDTAPEQRSPTRLGRSCLAMVVIAWLCIPDLRQCGAYLRHYGASYARVADELYGVSSVIEQARTVSGAFRANIAETARRLEVGQSVSVSLDNLVSILSPLLHRLRLASDRRQLRASPDALPFTAHGGIQHVLPSLLHMHNNRMGVDIRQEALLAMMCSQAIDPRSAMHVPRDADT